MGWLNRERFYWLTLPFHPFGDASARAIRSEMLARTGGFGGYFRRLSAGPYLLSREWADLVKSRRAFFRNPEVFQFLENTVMPELLTHPQPRIWCAGCASGEEPYSVAMLFLEALGPSAANRATITASDYNGESIEAARAAVYSGPVLEHVSASRRARFFQRDGERFLLNPDVRALCQFSKSDLLHDPPPAGPFHMILMRSVIGYLRDRSKAALLYRQVHSSLAPGGIAVFGAREPLRVPPDLFELAGPPEMRAYRSKRG